MDDEVLLFFGKPYWAKEIIYLPTLKPVPTVPIKINIKGLIHEEQCYSLKICSGEFFKSEITEMTFVHLLTVNTTVREWTFTKFAAAVTNILRFI